MNWIISDGKTTITLPYPPTTIKVKNPIKTDEVGIEGKGTILISRFPQAKTVTLTGIITAANKNNATLIAKYIAPLESLNRKIVTLADPDGQFQSTAGWVFQFEWSREQEAKQPIYRYTMTFKQGTGTDYLVVLNQ